MAIPFDPSVLESLPQLVYWKDRSLRYQGCNQAFALLAGLERPADIRGRTDDELPWAGPQAATLAAQDRLAFDSDSANPTETELSIPDRTVTLFIERRCLGEWLVAIGTDITRFKAAEEQWRREQRFSGSLLMLSRQLERAYSYDGLIEAIRNEVEAMLGYHTVWVYIAQRGSTRAVLLSAAGSVGPMVRTLIQEMETVGDPYLEEVMRGDHVALVEDARTDPRTDKNMVAMMGNVTIINVPLWLGGGRAGAFGTGTFGSEGVRVPDGPGMDYLKAVASHAAAAIDRIQLCRERRSPEQRA